MVQVISGKIGNVWTAIASDECRTLESKVKLNFWWRKFSLYLEKKGPITFNFGLTLASLGEKFNELIFSLKDVEDKQKTIDQTIQELTSKYSHLTQLEETFSFKDILEQYDVFRKTHSDAFKNEQAFAEACNKEIFKLHVNLPLTSKRSESTISANEIFTYLKSLIIKGNVNSAKAYEGLLEGSIDCEKIYKRFSNAAQMTIYLPRNLANDRIAEMVKEINSIALKHGIANMNPGISDAYLCEGVVSLRCDFENGKYVNYENVSEKHLQEQSELPFVKFMREQKISQQKAASPSKHEPRLFVQKKIERSHVYLPRRPGPSINN